MNAPLYAIHSVNIHESHVLHLERLVAKVVGSFGLVGVTCPVTPVFFFFFIRFLQEFCPRFQLKTPPGFQATDIPKGNLVHLLQIRCRCMTQLAG